MKGEKKTYREKKLKAINYLLANDFRLFGIIFGFLLFPVILSTDLSNESIWTVLSMLLINLVMARIQMLIFKVLLYSNRFGEYSMQMVEMLRVARTVDEHFEIKMIYDKLCNDLYEDNYLAHVLSRGFRETTKTFINQMIELAKEQTDGKN